MATSHDLGQVMAFSLVKLPNGGQRCLHNR